MCGSTAVIQFLAVIADESKREVVGRSESVFSRTLRVCLSLTSSLVLMFFPYPLWSSVWKERRADTVRDSELRPPLCSMRS